MLKNGDVHPCHNSVELLGRLFIKLPSAVQPTLEKPRVSTFLKQLVGSPPHEPENQHHPKASAETYEAVKGGSQETVGRMVERDCPALREVEEFIAQRKQALP